MMPGVIRASALLLLAGAACSPASGEPIEPAGSAATALAKGTWVGTWAASPQGCGMTFDQQTLRQVVHTSIAGTAARVQFSNAYGSSSVDIADVHVAQRTSDASVDPSTDLAVTFGGQSTTTIPAGGVAVSDSIAFPVKALSDVVVSTYFPQSENVGTCHQLGEQTNYIASGDVSGAATLANPQTTGSYYLLANLDVQNPDALGAVVTLGASITDGYASVQDANHRWPDFLAIRLNAAGLTVGVLNQGISGNDLLADGAGQSALNRFARDVIAQPGVRWVIASDDPINDLGSGNPPTADQLIAGLDQIIASAHQNGIQFWCSTLTPFQGAGYWTPTGEMGRDAYDATVRTTGSGCDAIVDQDTATHDPSMPASFLAADDCGDHLHPSDMGRQAIANAVPIAMFAAAVPQADAGAEAGDASGVDATTVADSGGRMPPATEGGADDASGVEAGEASEAGEAGAVSTWAPSEGSGCRVATQAPWSTRSDALWIAIVAGIAIGRRRRRRMGRTARRVRRYAR
jgi:lysophospholipase L1-like esterase